MGRGKTLTVAEIERIKIFNEQGFCTAAIARQINRSFEVVRNYLRDPENYGKNQRGRTYRATTERERRVILREASNSALTARQIRNIAGTSASVQTVRRVIKASPNIKRRKMKKKPHLTGLHKEARLLFCRERLAWTREWNKIIFSDEKKFNLDGPDGFSYYFHDLRKEERFLTRRHSRVGGVMVWAAISYNGPVSITVLEGKQTAQSYKTLLEMERSNITEKMQDSNWILQQDNAPIHTARLVKTWLEDEHIVVLPWPACSPDLNIIENVWGWLVKQIYEGGRQFDSRNQLIEAIKAAWEQLSLDYIRRLYESLPRRLCEVLENRGGHTHY